MLSKRLKFTLAVLVIFAVGVTALVFYRVLFLTFVRVPTGAMANTILPGDYLVIKKRSFGEIKRGNLILFKSPKDSSIVMLFRVVGLPGESLEINGRTVYINGLELKERHVTVDSDIDFSGVLDEISAAGSGDYSVFHSFEEGNSGSMGDELGIGSPYSVPADSYYVMGDNRDNSYDSRFWGTVPFNLIVGKPTMIYWSENAAEYGEEIRWERIGKTLK